jgi:hypothetical protein
VCRKHGQEHDCAIAAAARRRQIQLQSTGGDGAWRVAQAILARDGVPGFYRGFLPNALKNLPNKGTCPSSFRVNRDADGLLVQEHHLLGS